MTTEDTIKDHWEAVYRTKAPDTVSWYEETPALSLDLARAHADRRAAAIDIGAGASPLAGALLREGFADVSALDISGEALAVARRALSEDAARIGWIEADITRWRPERRYGLWHDRAVFHFLTDPADQSAYAETLRAALAPGGVAIIGIFAPDGPEMCSGLPVQRQDAETIGRVLGDGFALVETRRHDHRTPKGAVQRFQFSVFRRTAE